jgi:hypothetical protein
MDATLFTVAAIFTIADCRSVESQAIAAWAIAAC